MGLLAAAVVVAVCRSEFGRLRELRSSRGAGVRIKEIKKMKLIARPDSPIVGQNQIFLKRHKDYI